MAGRRPSSYLDPKHVFVGLPAGEREDVLKAFVDRLAEAGAFAASDATSVLRAVLKRERIGSTGVGRGIAIPHAKTSAVASPLVAFGRLVEPVPYGSADGAHVSSLFLVVSPLEAAEEHVAILRWIASIARSEYYAKVLGNTSDPESLYSLFVESDTSP